MVQARIRRNLIAQHEHFQRVPYRQFIARHWGARQAGPFPDPDDRQGTVNAFVDHGRWIVRCPHVDVFPQEELRTGETQTGYDDDGNPIVSSAAWTPVSETGEPLTNTFQCPGAVFVTETDPFFICTVCGNPENNGKAYGVTWPPNKVGIENVLLHRPVDVVQPAAFPWENRWRNWLPTETLNDLRNENIARGYPVNGPPPEWV